MTTAENFRCLSCGKQDGSLVLDLGNQPLANNLLRPEDLQKAEPRFPLRVAVCHHCWLLQILDLVPPVELFSEYLYFSSFSDALLKHSRASALRHIADCHLDANSFVVEIASNDGYLLRNFQEAGIPCLGIEPAANIAKVAREKGIESWVKFFGGETARELREEKGPADLILGNNVFAHAPQTNDFVAGLATALKPAGRVVLEFPYGVDLIEHTEFDTIYHEHVFYFTLTALIPLFERNGLEIFQVERIPIHGGSLRLFACHKGALPKTASVDQLLREEEGKGIKKLHYYETFKGQVEGIKRDLLALARTLREQGQTLAGYGASAKGSTLLNYVGLDHRDILFVADRSTHKQGRLTPGTHIPIVGPEALLEKRPGHALLLTWNFAEEILRQQAAYREQGGKFIVPIPQVKVV
jgi:SAM-dependent methyltransferase